MTIYQFEDDRPEIDPGAFIAAEATIIGRVSVGALSSVWPGAVLRGDIEWIRIGKRSSVQDNAVFHTDPGCPLTVGDDVTIGHGAVLHGCRIGDGALIGISAVVLNRAVIGDDCLVGASALVTTGVEFPPRSLIIGQPAKAVRTLTDEEVQKNRATAARYAQRAERYRNLLRPCP